MLSRSSRSATALALAATLLSACNLAPHYIRPAGAIPETLPQGGIYPPAASDAPDVTRLGWRDFFTDDRLRRVIQLGLDNNRDLRLAAATVLQARAQYRVQRADLFPTIAANAGATFTNSSFGSGGGFSGGSTTGTGTGTTGGATTTTTGASNIEIYQATVGFSNYEIDLFGRIRNLSRAAQEQYFATTEAQRAARVTLIAELATAWATMAADQDQLALSQRTLTAYRQSLDLTRAQFRVGVASELEARQAETQYEAARNDIALLRTQVLKDQNALNLLAGTTVPAELLPTALGAAEVTIPTLPAGLSSDVLLRRPDVLQAEHQLIAQNANIGAARAAFFPTISLTALLGTISTALSGLFGSGSFFYQAAPNASLPLFDGGRRGGNVAYARASQQAAVATYEKTLQTAFREVADALAQRGTIDEQLGAQVARANAAGVAARLSDARFRAGVDSFLTALDSQRTAYAAEQQLVTTRSARIANLIELYRALGGGLG